MQTQSAFLALCAGMARAAITTILLAATGHHVHAQAPGGAPDRPVRLMLPYPPGGSTDAVARLITQQLSIDWTQPVIVDNRPGASGMIGTEMAARAPADGHTALFAISQHIQNPLLYTKIPYDFAKDFVPVARILTVPSGLAVSSDLPVSNLKEFFELIRSQPGQHSYGSTGVASTAHIYGALLDKTAMLDAVHSPYKGAGPMLAELLGRRITFTVMDVGSLTPHVKAGKFKILATTGTQRVAALKDVPTFAEAGMPGFEALAWMGIALPAGTPTAIQAKWSASLEKYLTSPAFASVLADMGLTPNYQGPEAFAAQIVKDTAVWRTIISTANVRVE
jgi:tripartite-type tricarboxylate transporter receptor subunit TctC